VYEAEQLTTERRVALKLLSYQPGTDTTERMLEEARLASRLNSEHIVQIVDAGIDQATGAVFVVMDLLSGTTLADLVDGNGPCDFETATEYVRQIAAGLEKAHRHVERDGRPAPIVHRDLKPANVFVTRRDDGSELLKILDFGTAKMLSSNAVSSRIIRGTPQYMAPEQLAGDQPTPATDIWALGLLTFYLLTGRPYWLAANRDVPPEALFSEIHVLPLASASERARELGVQVELSPAFDAWFAHCIQRQPVLRFTSASLAAEQLARALSRAPKPAANVTRSLGHTTSVAWSAPQRRSRTGLVASGLALAALAAGTVTWFVTRAPPNADGLDRPAAAPSVPAEVNPSALAVVSSKAEPSTKPAASTAPETDDAADPREPRRTAPSRPRARPGRSTPPAASSDAAREVTRPDVYELR
jgi:serine/threonine-protein kinase